MTKYIINFDIFIYNYDYSFLDDYGNYDISREQDGYADTLKRIIKRMKHLQNKIFDDYVMFEDVNGKLSTNKIDILVVNVNAFKREIAFINKTIKNILNELSKLDITKHLDVYIKYSSDIKVCHYLLITKYKYSKKDYRYNIVGEVIDLTTFKEFSTYEIMYDKFKHLLSENHCLLYKIARYFTWLCNENGCYHELIKHIQQFNDDLKTFDGCLKDIHEESHECFVKYGLVTMN